MSGYILFCYDRREKETNNECKTMKIRQQIYEVHQFGYVHGQRENILLCEENQITERIRLFRRLKQLGKITYLYSRQKNAFPH